MTQRVTQHVTQRVTQCVTQHVTQLMTQHVTQLMTQRVTQRVTQPVTWRVTQRDTALALSEAPRTQGPPPPQMPDHRGPASARRCPLITHHPRPRQPGLRRGTDPEALGAAQSESLAPGGEQGRSRAEKGLWALWALEGCVRSLLRPWNVSDFHTNG